MKRAYVIIHGDLSTIPDIKKLIKETDILICADGASEAAYKQSLVPTAIVGDLDSITPKIKAFFKKKQVKWIQYPREKDYTDAELAIQFALESNVDELIIFGLLGNRVDHMLSNIFYISQIMKTIPCKIVEGKQDMYFVSKRICVLGKKNDELSLIPLKTDCLQVSTHGLYYPLDKETLPYGSTRGISNVFVEESITVELTSGLLLVVHRHT